MKEFIFQTPHEGNNVTILLYGSPVVGKSALARHLVHELSSVYNGAHYTINMKGMHSLTLFDFLPPSSQYNKNFKQVYQLPIYPI